MLCFIACYVVILRKQDYKITLSVSNLIWFGVNTEYDLWLFSLSPLKPAPNWKPWGEDHVLLVRVSRSSLFLSSSTHTRPFPHPLKSQPWVPLLYMPEDKPCLWTREASAVPSLRLTTLWPFSFHQDSTIQDSTDH